ncbi:MAG: efflux RND transporter permease subunit [Chitinispirillaceae bacterium]|nr:efflux RND transporter permease subunit [Chitinispirillaceae bacterium]
MKCILKNRHFILIVSLLLVFWGIFSFITIPRSEDPQIEFTGSSIFVLLPGASPEEVEKLVVDPIEEELNKLHDINRFSSSSSENVALINIEFNVYTDPDTKYREVTSAVDNIRAALPADIARLEVTKYSSSDVVMLQYALVCEQGPYQQLVKTAEVLKKRLQRISGVEEVNLHAYPQQQVNIEIVPEKLEGVGVSLSRIAEIVRGANTTIPGGSILADGRRFSIRVNSEFQTLDDIGSTIVGAYGPQCIRLSDIASISLDDADTLYCARFNGKRAVFLTVSQKKGTNIFPLTKAVKREVAAFTPAPTIPIHIELVFDQSQSVDRRLNGFFVNLLQGLVLVSLVMLLTLGLRAAAIIAVVIPMSILTAIGMLDMLGFGLDQISIVALAIALGMLVDNGIVVVELVSRKKQQGKSGDEAAAQSIAEIGWAIVNSTLTTVIAFLPLAFLHSHVGEFIRGLPLTVIFALSASLLFALTVTPLLAAKLMPVSGSRQTNRFRNLLYIVADNGYRRLLRRMLTRPKTVLLIAALFFAGTLSLLPFLKVSLFPSAEKPQVYISIETPKGSSLSRVDSVARAVEAILSKLPDVRHYATNLGKGNPRIYYNMFSLWESPNIGQILVTLASGREAHVVRMLDTLRQRCSAVPAARIHIQELQQGMPVAAPVAFRIFGDNLDSITTYAAEVEAIIASTPGTINIRNPSRESRTDLRVSINRDKASLAGVAPAQVALALRTAILGQTVTRFREASGDDYPVVLHAGKASAPFMEELERVSVSSITGDKVPLRQIAVFSFEQSPSIINHYHLERSTAVLSDVKSGFNTARITAEVRGKLLASTPPQGVKWKVAGEEESREESFGGITKALLIALIGIFAVLVLQFRNFSQPFIVFTAIPFAVTGSIITLLVTGYSFSFTAFIGFTSLMGIVVNNSIILIDCANQLRATGIPLFDTAVNACTQRFTPIILTTVTTLLGLFPLVLSGSSLWAPLSWVITGGLSVSMLLTLFVVPALYLIYSGGRGNR